jgi:hypothetical protein
MLSENQGKTAETHLLLDYKMNDFHNDLLKLLQTHTQPIRLIENNLDKD